MKLIRRDFYLGKLKAVMGTPKIMVISGLRRNGKEPYQYEGVKIVGAADRPAGD